ncbi:MAG TPA: bifunctional YncE family protein/alkaline phosphatase family protein [Candidatus Deferrimicrobiaceae bacterium]|nr:bifunctional YncE family protein/alkaline phosphatase family protein [Candidatus Deferrimicrobiaceae bacterium]
MIRFSRVVCFAAIFFSLRIALSAQAAQPGQSSIPLPTSKRLNAPAPGRIGSTNGFPATIAISPNGRYAALLNDGYGIQETLATQSIAVLDLKTNQLADYPDKRFNENAHQSYFLGLVFGSDGKHLYASVGSVTDPSGEKEGDTGNGIAVYKFRSGKVEPERFIAIGPQALATEKKVSIELRKTAAGTAIPYPAGLALAGGGHGKHEDQLLVANNLSDNVVLLDVASGKVLQSFDLSSNRLVPASFPYTVVVTRDGRRAWCSLWNGSQVAELNLTDGKVARWIKLKQPEDPIAPGSHPTAMLLSPDEKWLYVALSNADAVAVVSTETAQMVALLSTKIKGQEFAGNYPGALAQSADGKRLFVADASSNAVAVFDTSTEPSRVGDEAATLLPLGFIPTDWYPSALAVHGDDLLIATAKGEGTGPNNREGKTAWEVKHHDHVYIATLLRGSIARLSVPSTLGKLEEFTRTVENDNLLHDDADRDNPETIRFAGGRNPIKHVIYVIKENRTYDQILGDLKAGNGDSTLTMYGADITPNEHKLALQFGVLDNFYDSGEVSGDGHLWSTAAITSDYNEKTWQIAYRGKERTYDFQGTVAGEFPLEHKEADIDDPSTGFLWDNLARHGVSYRDYGEYVNAVWCNKLPKASSPKQGTPSQEEAACPRTEVEKGDDLEPNVGNPHGGSSPWPWAVPLFREVKATKAVLRDHFDPLYPDFNTDYPDQLRADEFLNEFAAYKRAREGNEGAEFELPAFVLLYFPDDHTGGTRPEKPRPQASVADNDLAVGRLVEAVSHSPYWNDTAIFILEDDAQNGADHVDAHRSIAFVVSKFSPGKAAAPYVDHRFYTTVNLIHTMEMLLGLPAMNQNDAYAPAMAPLFSGAGEQVPFQADYRNLKNGLIYETNKRDAPGGKESAKMDFSRPDAAGAARLNRVLWRDQKGDAPMPAPKHTVLPAGDDD